MDRLIIFIKNPVKGKVKTRLAATIGEEKALDIYKILLDHTRKICLDFPGKRLLYYSDQINENDSWQSTDFEKHIQQGDDLGQRMYQAFDESFKSEQGKICIIGSDCFELNVHHLKQAFEKLDKADLVFGPSKDGGYYLLGMKESHEALFKDISWSTSEVLKQSLNAAEKLGLETVLLPTLSDVDTESDLQTMGITL